jgi:hypothetical protein
MSQRALKVTSHHLTSTAYYADVLAPQKITDMSCLPCDAFRGETTIGGFGLAFASAQCKDIDAKLGALRRLGPHLMRAVDLCFELTQWRGEGRRFQAGASTLAPAPGPM